MLIPIRTDYRLSHTPWVNYALLAANVVIYFMGFNAATVEAQQRIWGWMLHPGSPELYQFFSSMFLHGSFMHLAGNMLFLWIFGNAMNDRFGHVGYLSFYLAGGVLAGVGYLLLTPNAPVLGASGAISGVTGAFLVLLPRTRVLVLAFILWIIPFEITSLLFLAFQFIWNLWMSLGQMTGPGAGGVAYVAHSAGYLYGIGISALLLGLRLLPRDPFDLLNLLKGWRRRQKYRRMAAQGWDPFGGAPHRGGEPKQGPRRWVASRSEPAPPVSEREMQLRGEIAEACARHDLSTAAGKYLQLVQIAENVVLSRQNQLDVANQLMSTGQHPAAADAYERFRRQYPSYENIGDIELMLGLLYGRYLEQYDKAEVALAQAGEKLQEPRKKELARDELEAVRRKRRS